MSYSDYLNTNYSACGMDDHYADSRDQILAEEYYEIGFRLFELGDLNEANKYYQKSLELGRGLGWDKRELPEYNVSN